MKTSPMIKILFSILTLIVFSQLNGQEKLASKNFEISDSLTKLKYIDQVFRMEDEDYCDFYIGIDEEIEFKEFLNSHYNNFILIKSKVDTVLIFEGKRCPGFESGEVIVYKIEEGKLFRHFSKSGKIAYLENKHVTIHTYPCCAMITNVLSKFDIENSVLVDSNHVFFSTFNHTDFSDIEHFRRTTKSNQKIKLKKEVELRWIDNTETPVHPVSACENNNTNKIGSFEKATVGSLIKYNKEKTWALIQLNSANAKEMYCPLNFEKTLLESKEYYVYGWIKLEDFIKK